MIDGQTERASRTRLVSIIRNFARTNFDNWDTLLPVADFSYNNSKHKCTQETPFFLNNGIRIHLMTRISSVPVDTDVATTYFLETATTAKESARTHITTAQRQQKKKYDGLQQDYSRCVGDFIKLFTEDTHLSIDILPKS